MGGTIDISDLAVVIANYGGDGLAYPDGDVNGDWQVGLADLSFVLSGFGSVCDAPAEGQEPVLHGTGGDSRGRRRCVQLSDEADGYDPSPLRG